MSDTAAAAVLVEPGAPRLPACDCHENPELHAALARGNGRLGAWRHACGSRTPVVYLRRLDACGPMPPPLVPSYCPFCGERYEERAGGA